MQPTQAWPWGEKLQGKLPVSAAISQAEQKEMQLVVRLSQIDTNMRSFFFFFLKHRHEEEFLSW